MPGRLKELEIENFKSYEGKHTIGPFRSFTAIIGPNGSGKSNLMDAICFVLGEKASNMRVTRVSDLIHGACINKPVSTRCHVTLTYVHESQGRSKQSREQMFTRAVVKDQSEYRIDGKIVPLSQYMQELEKIHIFTKAKNFLVYQGQVEKIAMKDPKERTKLFEKISKSGELKAEYDRTKAEMQKAEEDVSFNYTKRKGLANERREAKAEREEAEKYQSLKTQMAETNIQLYLCQLYHNEKEQRRLADELAQKQTDLEELRVRKAHFDKNDPARQRELKRAQREFAKLDQEIRKKEDNQQSEAYVKAVEAVRYQKRKIEEGRTLLNARQQVAMKHMAEIRAAEALCKEQEKKRRKIEEELKTAASSDLNLSLSDAQLAEYYTLQEKVGRVTSLLQAELEELKRDYHVEQENLKYETQCLSERQQRIKLKNDELERQRHKIEAHNEQLEQAQSAVDKERVAVKELDKQVHEMEEAIAVVNEQMREVARKLAEIGADERENYREERRKALIADLKRIFPDRVYGRLVDICVPSHKRYRLAVTRALGKHMNSIVVDNEITARECIQYQREQQYGSEQYLPLSYLEVKPIDEQLRTLSEPLGVHLVLDVIEPTTPAIQRALQFALGNALVCDTADGARQLAFDGAKRQKVVSLDGTLFHKNGVISSSTDGLKAKAKRWETVDMDALCTQKNELRAQRNKLREKMISNLQKRNQLAHEVTQKREALAELETRVKFLTGKKAEMEAQQVMALERELEALNAEAQLFALRIDGIKRRMTELEKKIADLEKRANSQSDIIFKDFCARIGIANIRVYEECELAIHTEKRDRINDILRTIDRLQREIAYMQTEDCELSVKLSQERLKELEKELKKLEADEKKELAKVESYMAQLEQLRKERDEKRKVLEASEREAVDAKNQASNLSKELINGEKQLLQLEQAITLKRGERHTLLENCRINDVDIPFISGSLADMVDDREPSSSLGSATESSAATTTNGASQLSDEVLAREMRLKVDFRRLENDYKIVGSDAEMKRVVDQLQKQLKGMQEQLSKIQAPNMHADERLLDIKTREEEASREFESARKRFAKAKKDFETVKAERLKRFNDFYEAVAQEIDDTYKLLSRNQAAQAYLAPDDAEEPYNDGIQYNCVAPGKRFRAMDNLSGGEKTVAALALLFAIHARNPSPFFVLDEVDAALDNTNIGKVVSFIREQSERNMQVIVISLKEELYNRSDSLIGIYPEPGPCTVSGELTLDLTKYRDTQTER